MTFRRDGWPSNVNASRDRDAWRGPLSELDTSNSLTAIVSMFCVISCAVLYSLKYFCSGFHDVLVQFAHDQLL